MREIDPRGTGDVEPLRGEQDRGAETDRADSMDRQNNRRNANCIKRGSLYCPLITPN
jgi:hypothetical protein